MGDRKESRRLYAIVKVVVEVLQMSDDYQSRHLRCNALRSQRVFTEQTKEASYWQEPPGGSEGAGGTKDKRWLVVCQRIEGDSG